MYPFNCRFKVTSPYGSRYFNGKTEFHNGIDLVTLCKDHDGKHIGAVMSGTLASSAWVKDPKNRTSEWGNYICIAGDDGKRYYYCHLADRIVKTIGMRINVGDYIGIMGSTGYSTGEHLHFEVRANNAPIDPCDILGIANSIGEYGIDYRSYLQQSKGLSDQTMKWMDGAPYPYALFRKLVT